MAGRIEKIAVLGAGKMGSGIAQFFATKGYPVKIIQVFDDKQRGTSAPGIKANLELLSQAGVLDAGDIPDIISRITYVDAIEEAADCDLVFEAIVENLATKQEFFARMDQIFPPEAVLASNTSAISITQIAEKTEHKERVLGTHFWDPPYLIPLVEVIKTEDVSQETVDSVYELMNATGKKPVLVQKDVPGFLANRMQHALFREALSIVEKGIASPEDVDTSIKYGFGMRLGISPPIEVMDRGGLDLTHSIHSYLFPHLEDSKEPLAILKEKMEAGQLGVKTGKGLLDWDEEKARAANENLVQGLIKVVKALDRL